MSTQMSIEELVINGHIAPANRSRVQTELVSVCKFYPSLNPCLMSYIDNFGNESLLITLQGTVPMHFHGNTYYTPVNIFVPTEYPAKPPIAFVRPSTNMIIKQDHPNVTPNGECTHSYLTKWDPAFNTLSGAVRALSDDFSKISPLFSKSSPPPASRPISGPYPQPQQQARPQQYGGAVGPYPRMTSSPNMSPAVGPYPRISSSPTLAPSSAAGPYPYPQNPPAQRTVSPREVLSGKVRSRLARDSQPAIDLRKKLYEAEVELTRELAYLQEMERSMPQLAAELDRIKAECDTESASIRRSW